MDKELVSSAPQHLIWFLSSIFLMQLGTSFLEVESTWLLAGQIQTLRDLDVTLQAGSK